MGWFLVALLAAVVAGIAWWTGRSATRRRGRLLATETSTVATLTEVAAAATGAAGAGSYREVVELSGEAHPGPGGRLTSPETGTPCVWHRHTVTRRYKKVTKDAEGKKSTSTAEETVTSETSSTPFVLRDGTGEVLVEASGGVDGARKSLSEFREGRRGGGRDTIGFEHEEWVLEPGTRLFVAGEVSDDGGVLTLRKPAKGDLVVTTRSEEQLLDSAAGSARTASIVAKVAGAAAVVLAVVGLVSLL
ncbi:MAG: E3 ubiquitin ligase family protein [Actinobacteria bacterium]|jgi:hypothetical protein|nr:E3 ubiquitin ligase family protein [Actinomycetota bacterium]